MNEEILNIIKEISGSNARQCMMCGKCSARCPNFDEFDIKPHQFVNMINKGNFDILFNSKTITRCLTCLECVERCPRNVAPANLIDAIKEIASREKPFLTADNIPPVIDENTPQQLIVSAFRKFN